MEVGKKYTHSCGFIFTCESITKLGNVVVSWDGDGGRKNEAVVREEDFKRYTEYKGPVVHKWYVLWYNKDGTMNCFTTTEANLDFWKNTIIFLRLKK